MKLFRFPTFLDESLFPDYNRSETDIQKTKE